MEIDFPLFNNTRDVNMGNSAERKWCLYFIYCNQSPAINITTKADIF